MGRLSGNMFDMKRLFAPGQSLRFEFFPVSDDFFIMNFDKTKSPPRLATRKVTDIRLITRQVSLMPSLALAIANESRAKPFLYPFNRVLQRSLFISGGSTVIPFNFVSHGYMPSRCIVGLVQRGGFTGAAETNPYSFEHNDVKQCYLRAGSEVFPADSLKRRPYDFKNKQYCRAYKSLIDCMALDNESGFGHLTYESFGFSNCLFAFDLTSNMNASDLQVWKSQSLQLYIDFGESPVPAGGVQAVIFLELQSILQLDAVTGSVIIDPPGI
jgi:hypothetical protein